MTAEEIQAILGKNVTVTPRINGAMFMIVANDGYWIFIKENVLDFGDYQKKLYKKTVILNADYDWESVEVTAEADLPDNAETASANIPVEKA